MLLVLTNMPDQASAESLADFLIKHRLVACINILAPCTSVYHWQGKVERAMEIPMLIKTPEKSYDAVETAIRSRHPYELPEIIAVRVSRGLPAYLAWVEAETLSDISSC